MVTKKLANSRKIRTLYMTPVVLGTMCMLSACGSTNMADMASALGSKGKAIGRTLTSVVTTPTPTPSPAPTPTPTPTPSGTVSYDTSIGNGVDANGYANLPLRSGAQRYFVNSSTGSDNNSCSAAQSPSAPKKTMAAGLNCVANGNGDQVLVAEGTTYAETLPTFWSKAGYSLVYPTVLESYDPSDPTNEAKYGRATSGRPVVTMTNTSSPILMGVVGQGFIAIRGFDVNPGNLTRQGVSLVDGGDGILIENNIFRYTGVSFDVGSSPMAHHWIIRNNAIYGNWDSDPTFHTQGIYVDGTDSLTVEDNVLWHNGWKVDGAGRDSSTDGATIFRHAIYQTTRTNSTIRRNLIVDGSADGGSHRGDATISENVYIDNPISIAAGGGVNYNVYRPNGDALTINDNAVLGSVNLTSTSPRGWGLDTANGNTAASAYHNLFARGQQIDHVFSQSADFNQPSYMNYHDNVSYMWSPAGKSTLNYGQYPAQDLPTYNNNIWDDPASGTNTNISTHTFPNPYTAAQLYAALGFTDKTSLMTYAVNHPEAHIQRNARSLLFAGYGM